VGCVGGMRGGGGVAQRGGSEGLAWVGGHCCYSCSGNFWVGVFASMRQRSRLNCSSVNMEIAEKSNRAGQAAQMDLYNHWLVIVISSVCLL
jgi:hypothetical protein